MMGWAALIALCQQFFPDFAETAAHYGLLPHSHGHSHSHGGLGPNINAAWLAGGSIIIKEWLYRASMLHLPELVKDSANSLLKLSKSPRKGNPQFSLRMRTTTVSTPSQPSSRS